MKSEERLNNIDAIIARVNESVLVTKNKWIAMSSSIPSAKTLDKEVLPQIKQSLSSLSSIDIAIKRNHYYGKLLSLTTKETESLCKDLINNIAMWEVFTNNARNIVESMYKAEMFDGFEDDDLFMSLNSSVDNFCNTFFDEPTQLICDYLQKPWLEDRINIGLFGKYSSGKTTILNCLYGENFPTNNAENTAVPTYLYHGQDTDNMILVDVKGGYTKIDEVEAAVLDSNLSESFPFYRLYEYIAKQNPAVPKNRTIIDAPGVMGKNSDVPVINALKQCDIIVWLLDIREGLGKPELEFIKKHVTRPLFIVLTYTDRKNEHDYYQALSIIADGFKKSKVDIKGYIRYNKYEEDKFREEFNNTINMSISKLHIEPQNPYSYVKKGVLYISDILKINEQYYTKVRNNANNEVLKYQNSVKSDREKLSDRIDSLVRRNNELVDHFENNFIAGKGFKVKINAITDGIVHLVKAWKSFDQTNIVELAISSRKEQEAIYKLQQIETLKQDFKKSVDKLLKKINKYEGAYKLSSTRDSRNNRKK